MDVASNIHHSPASLFSGSSYSRINKADKRKKIKELAASWSRKAKPKRDSRLWTTPDMYVDEMMRYLEEKKGIQADRETPRQRIYEIYTK